MPFEIRTHPWHDTRHHRDGGFRNIWGTPQNPPLGKTLRWLLSHTFSHKENRPPPVRPVAPEALLAPANPLRLTWIGHATALVQRPGLNLITDPVFADRASPLPFAGPERETPLPLTLDDLPPIDVVLLSHNHYDHLDRDAVRTLHRRDAPLFVAPLGVGALLRRWGLTRVLEFDWWQYVDLDGMRLNATPARHFSGRGLTDRNRTLWAGWYLSFDDGLRFYFAGDSGYAPLFTEIREHFGPPDLALIPIGAYLPRWLMAEVHVDPEEAARAVRDLDTRHVVPIHWGTFDLAEEPLHEPPVLFRRHTDALGLTERIHILDVGGRFEL